MSFIMHVVVGLKLLDYVLQLSNGALFCETFSLWQKQRHLCDVGAQICAQTWPVSEIKADADY